MKANLSALLLTCLPLAYTSTQVRYTGEEFRDYYQWFHQYSQTSDFYQDGTTLLTFIDNTPLRSRPSAKSALKVNLPLGKTVTNVVIPVESVVLSTENGYTDQWFLVETCTTDRNVIRGYIWGGHLAKSWRFLHNKDDNNPSIVAFGLANQYRQRPEDIKASLKIIYNAGQEAEIILDGFCLFEECGASSLLRVFDYARESALWMFEASTFTTGCLTGVDKALVSWDGQEMRLIYQAEYTTGHTYASHPLYLRDEMQTQICYYESENENFDPVWTCRTLDGKVVIP